MGPTAARRDAPSSVSDGGPWAGQGGFPWAAPPEADDAADAPEHAADAPDAPAPGAGLPPWAQTPVPTEAPSLDAVLDGSAPVAGTFRDANPPTRNPFARGPRRPAVARGTGVSAARGGDARSITDRTRAGRDAVRRGASGAAGAVRSARSVAGTVRRRRTSGLFSRRSTLLGATGLSLVAGVGVAAALDAVTGPAEPVATDATAVVAAPEVCAPAQVAWSRAAAAQVQMDVESPASLRKGFGTAREALAAVTPPDAVATEWATVSDYVSTMAEATAEAEDGQVEAAAAEALATLDTAAMTTASEQVTAYLADDCGS